MAEGRGMREEGRRLRIIRNEELGMRN